MTPFNYPRATTGTTSLWYKFGGEWQQAAPRYRLKAIRDTLNPSIEVCLPVPLPDNDDIFLAEAFAVCLHKHAADRGDPERTMVIILTSGVINTEKIEIAPPYHESEYLWTFVEFSVPGVTFLKESDCITIEKLSKAG